MLTQLRHFGRLLHRLNLSLISLLSLLIIPAMQVSAAPIAQTANPACVFTPIHPRTITATDLSADGNNIAYSDYVDIPEWGAAMNFFLYNRTSGQSHIATLTYNGEISLGVDNYTSRPALSADGRIYAFLHEAPDMLPNSPSFQIYARDMLTGQLEIISQNNGVFANQGAWNPVVSLDGRYVAFDSEASTLGYSNPTFNRETYLYDRSTKELELISIASDGSRGGGVTGVEYDGYQIGLSADARYVVFTVNNLKGDDGVVYSGVFLRDRTDQRTYFIADGMDPTMTPSGRYIVFDSSSELLPTDQNPANDLYLYDRITQQLELITVGPNGISEPTSTTYSNSEARISADGSQVVFSTRRPNIVDDNDTNNLDDVFVRNRTRGITERLTVNAQGQEANAESRDPSISADGRLVVFHTKATNLLPSGAKGVYLCQRDPASFVTGTTLYLPLINR